jgi:hypothetical protein
MEYQLTTHLHLQGGERTVDLTKAPAGKGGPGKTTMAALIVCHLSAR